MLIDLNDLGSKSLKLKSKIKIRIEGNERDGFAGFYDELNIYTFDGPMPETIEEVKDDIIDLYNFLMVTPNSRLSLVLLKHKNHLREIIEAVEVTV